MSFPLATIFSRELGQTRCSSSSSTHRCSSSDTKHRHWSRCSHYPPRRGLQQYLLIIPPAPRSLESSTIPSLGKAGDAPPFRAARFRFCAAHGCFGFDLGGLQPPDCAHPITRPPYHRLAYQSDHRKRGQTRGPSTSPTHRCPSPDTKHRHWSRCSHYPPRRGCSWLSGCLLYNSSHTSPLCRYRPPGSRTSCPRSSPISSLPLCRHRRDIGGCRR